MNILKEVLKHEVYPALGCTEPIAVAYACANASKLIKNPDYKTFKISVNMDPATYKNGYGVSLPNTKNAKGNLIAAALGTLVKKPELKHKIFSKTDSKILKKAKEMIKNKKVNINVDYTKKELYIEAVIEDKKNKATAIISSGHFNISFLSLNGKTIKSSKKIKTDNSDAYKEIIKNLDIKDLVSIADKAGKEELDYIKKGIETNLNVSKQGLKLNKVSANIRKMLENGIINDDVINRAKIITTAATDARMAGLPYHVMSSGQSGNQGVVAILVPYIVGTEYNITEKRILKSIALSHLINSYIKVFTGELAPVCGCAISGGAGATAAIVYQQNNDIHKIESAINNLIADLAGMFCDGAKESCSLKVASSTESSIRAAFLALNGYSVNQSDGFISKRAKETIKNMARLSIIGMSSVDSIIIDSMEKKNAAI